MHTGLWHDAFKHFIFEPSNKRIHEIVIRVRIRYRSLEEKAGYRHINARTGGITWNNSNFSWNPVPLFLIADTCFSIWTSRVSCRSINPDYLNGISWLLVGINASHAVMDPLSLVLLVLWLQNRFDTCNYKADLNHACIFALPINKLLD